ncbi:MAG: major capsid protein [Microviridae sp.]|nr:MAG: major capsid protein [Microviridae sp.]
MKRNKFSLSHYKLTTADMGNLIPISCYEVLPGDTVQQNTSALIRCTPLATPPMHPVKISIHHWYVPTRILWDGFEDFITGGDYGSVPPVHPFMVASGGWAAGTLADHFGLPLNVNNLTHSALPFRAYAKIFNDQYRDQDLTAELPISYGDGADSTTNTLLQSSNWQSDYFTKARPWPQKSPDITIPMGATTGTGQNPKIRWSGNANPTALQASPGNAITYGGGATATPTQWYWDKPEVQVNGGTINQLREAFALQRYAEARARYGSRYTEYLRFLGISSSDARLQRPEFCGGGKTTLQFSEVLQTGPSSEDGSQTVGQMFGHGMGSVRSNRFRRFFEEHGFVITLMQIMPKPIYSQGMERMWSRADKEDYYQRELEHIGQQPISQREIYVSDADPAGAAVFGYTNRYQEYRQKFSEVSNGFRPGSLYDDWTFSRAFTQAPVLNDSFLRGAVTKRPFADQSNNTLLIMARHSIQARRMMSKTAQSYVL